MDIATVRTIALHPTAGLKRGVVVQNTGGAVGVPIGDAVLGCPPDAQSWGCLRQGGEQSFLPGLATGQPAITDSPTFLNGLPIGFPPRRVLQSRRPGIQPFVLCVA